jgi:uncharacterized phage protein gp47/JayE
MYYSDLLVDETREGIEKRLRDSAKAKGSSPDTWKDRSVSAVLVYALSVVLLFLYQLQKFFAGGASFTPDTNESLAERWAYSQFGLTRTSATSSVFTVTLICEADQGPHDLTTDFKLSTSWGQEYFLTEAFTLESGASALVYFRAVVPGTAGNVAPEQLSIVVTPLAGVSSLPEDLYTAGSDQETIAALYARCQLMWAGIGAGSTEFVQLQALQVDPLLTKVKTRVDNTGISGQMQIYVGQVAGPATLDQTAALAERINSLQVFQAVNVSFAPPEADEIHIIGTVYAFPGQQSAAEEAVSEAVTAWQAELTYGAVIRESDFWRKLFSSSAINYVELTVDSVYNVDEWELPVLVNDLDFDEA